MPVDSAAAKPPFWEQIPMMTAIHPVAEIRGRAIGISLGHIGK